MLADALASVRLDGYALGEVSDFVIEQLGRSSRATTREE